MLKLYLIYYYRIDDRDNTLEAYVLGYNPCHAVNLLYRDFDSRGQLNDYRHCSCIELSCIHPSQFKKQYHG